MKIEPVDAKLNEIALMQLTWKPGPMRNIACAIVRHAVNPDTAAIWPDEVNLPPVLELDKNCIGSAWRLLTKAGILAPEADFRRSKAKEANGRKVFRYSLASARMAYTFLKRNGGGDQNHQGTLL